MKNLLEKYGNDSKKLNKILRNLRLKNKENPDYDFEYVNQDSSWIDFDKINFSNLTIRAMNMNYCKMLNCHYELGHLTYSKIQYSKFHNTSFDGLFIELCSFGDCKFEYCDFSNASFVNVIFWNCEFVNCNFNVNSVELSCFKKCTFDGCYHLDKCPSTLASFLEKDDLVFSAFISKYLNSFQCQEMVELMKFEFKEKNEKLAKSWLAASHWKDYVVIRRLFSEYKFDPFVQLIEKQIPPEEKKQYLKHVSSVYSDFEFYLFLYKSSELSIDQKNNLESGANKQMIIAYAKDETLNEDSVWNFIKQQKEDFIEKIKYEIIK